MRHVGAIAGRELRSFFVSPVAYVVLTLWALLAGSFFLSSLVTFQDAWFRAQQTQDFAYLEQLNLNDGLIAPFIGSMWIILLIAIPAVTMSLFASERSNGTEELLLTSPLSIWEIVLGKFLAGAGFVLLMTAIVGFFPLLVFTIGEPEWGKTAAGLLGLLLMSLSYVAVGAFASALTRSPLIAFVLTLVLLVGFGLILPFLVEVGSAGDSSAPLVRAMSWISTGHHFDPFLGGLVSTADLGYFAVVIGVFLLLAKTAVESVRWR